mgnify:CR=1 FL=1
MKSLFHIFPIKSRLFPLNPVYSPALGILFDGFIRKNRAIYTFENICIEDKTIPLHDGTKKIILNAKAFKETDNQELRGFLQYVTTGKATTAYTGRIEQMIQNRAIDYPNYSPPRKIPAITKIRHTGTKTYCI